MADNHIYMQLTSCSENVGVVRVAAAAFAALSRWAGAALVTEGAAQRREAAIERLARGADLPFAAELSLELGRRGVPVGMHIETTTLKEELCRLLSKA